MRTITRKTVVPEKIKVIEAHEEEETVYGCDLCDFEREDEDEVKVHYGRKHAAKEIKEIGGHSFVKFETEMDMEAWADAQCDHQYGGGVYDGASIDWVGSGWYQVSGKNERCSRNCCTNYILCFKPLESVISNLKWEITIKDGILEDIKSELLPDE
jgi:hypothetical protein